MGFRNADPPSPASQWLRRLDQKEQGAEEQQQQQQYAGAEDVAMDLDHEPTRAAVGTNAVNAVAAAAPHRHGVDCATMARREPASIDEAIELASPRALRKLLRMMVYSQQTSMDLATAYLIPPLVPAHSDSSLAIKASRKRRMYETCQHCRAEFEPGNNREERCSYHPGHKTSISYGSAYAQSVDAMFQWTCCNQLANSAGCVWGRHQPTNSRSQRPRAP